MEGVGVMSFDLRFYRGRRVFLTGHTGFKGSWMSRVLVRGGAVLTGYSLQPPTEPNLFSLAGVENSMTSVIGDVRDFSALKRAFVAAQPEIVIHMAAQPLVRESYQNPRYTYETNVMGTVNLLDCVRSVGGVRSFLNVTTDKVYKNQEWHWGYRENEPLDGFDPYSNSKSCSELVTHSYCSSFFQDGDAPAISTARAGNVIGGGDFARDRIIPDCVRAAVARKTLEVRSPQSIRPYQHVLESVMAYLMIVARQYQDRSVAGWYNVGPDECDCVSTGELVELFAHKWGEGFSWKNREKQDAPHEATFLKLDCSKVKKVFNWKPRWHIDEAVQKTVEWTKMWREGCETAGRGKAAGSIGELSYERLSCEMDAEISDYLEGQRRT